MTYLTESINCIYLLTMQGQGFWNNGTGSSTGEHSNFTQQVCKVGSQNVLAQQFENALTLGDGQDDSSNFQGAVQGKNFITPGKDKCEEVWYGKGALEATKLKGKKELSSDRFATPPRRTTIPTHEELSREMKRVRRQKTRQE